MILSIESSCDDSSVAVTSIKTKQLIFHKKISQEEQHNKYEGVVPELASRLHAQNLPQILKSITHLLPSIKAVAVTTSPGLKVSLIQGITMAKAIAITLNIPYIPINHLTGHIFSLFIEKEKTIYPMHILLASGGHTQIMQIHSQTDIKTISKTLDDSFGESFDKVAKMLGLGYPGGATVEKYAKQSTQIKYNFTVPMLRNKSLNFSYSGLKQGVKVQIEKLKQENEKLTKTQIQDICASFQFTAIKHIEKRLTAYFSQNKIQDFAIVGGASANKSLRQSIEKICKTQNTKLHLCNLQYCSDNAAMIGRAAIALHDDLLSSL